MEFLDTIHAKELGLLSKYSIQSFLYKFIYLIFHQSADLLCFVKGVSFLSYGEGKPIVKIPRVNCGGSHDKL